MPNPLPSLTRYQLSKFLPTPEAIRAFELLFSDNSDYKLLVDNLIEGTGLNTDGTYSQYTSGEFISLATSLYVADQLLDKAIFDETRALVTTITASASLLPANQSILADATAGSISLTMPNPASGFTSSRSFRIGITKIDTTTNVVNILPYGSETIAGGASESLLKESEVLNFITDGTNWHLEK